MTIMVIVLHCQGFAGLINWNNEMRWHIADGKHSVCSLRELCSLNENAEKEVSFWCSRADATHQLQIL